MAVTGIATMSDAIAYIVTNCPAAASDTSRSRLICGKRPAGRASVRMLTKLAVASASSPSMGKRAAQQFCGRGSRHDVSAQRFDLRALRSLANREDDPSYAGKGALGWTRPLSRSSRHSSGGIGVCISLTLSMISLPERAPVRTCATAGWAKGN